MSTLPAHCRMLIALLLIAATSALAADRDAERNIMVNDLKDHGTGPTRVTDERVLEAMRTVPRHLFVPASQRGRAYADSPLPIGHGQTISQPYMVALMTQLLELEPGMHVLEVGTGSGYQAAILAELTDNVCTIEIIVPLAKEAQERFRKLGYDDVRATEGDGYYGWEACAPFDRIVVTAAAAHIPPPLIAQLKPGGRMAIPVGPKWGAQRLMLVEKDDDGEVTTRSMLSVAFVPLTGGPRDP